LISPGMVGRQPAQTGADDVSVALAQDGCSRSRKMVQHCLFSDIDILRQGMSVSTAYQSDESRTER
jgi:hypothetical protein